jgi:hypothetical protein
VAGQVRGHLRRAPVPLTRATDLDSLVASLATVSIGRTFNQYRDGGGDDRDPATAPAARTENLRTYLRSRAGARVLLVGEAAGWRGARYSGIALLSERLILERDEPYRTTSRNPRGFAEPSATIVRGVLRDGGWEEETLVWNTVQTHPFAESPHTNRPPSRAETIAGRELLLRLIEIVRPAHVVALGRVAASALPAELHAVAVRHPAQSGATLCRAQLGEALRGWLH